MVLSLPHVVPARDFKKLFEHCALMLKLRADLVVATMRVNIRVTPGRKVNGQINNITTN